MIGTHSTTIGKADALSLQFLNAFAHPLAKPPAPGEAGDRFVAWLEEMRLVPTGALEAIRSEVVPGELDAVAAQARALAGWFRAFVDRYKGASLPAAAVEELRPINRILEGDLRYGQIEIRDAGGLHNASSLGWRSRRQWRAPESLLLPIAEAMAELVCSEDFTLVRECEGNGCHRLFLDRTRSKARRWCSMAVCGNRAKQATRRGRL
jgi:hypothetical protein